MKLIISSRIINAAVATTFGVMAQMKADYNTILAGKEGFSKDNGLNMGEQEFPSFANMPLINTKAIKATRINDTVEFDFNDDFIIDIIEDTGSMYRKLSAPVMKVIVVVAEVVKDSEAVMAKWTGSDEIKSETVLTPETVVDTNTTIDGWTLTKTESNNPQYYTKADGEESVIDYNIEAVKYNLKAEVRAYQILSIIKQDNNTLLKDIYYVCNNDLPASLVQAVRKLNGLPEFAIEEVKSEV